MPWEYFTDDELRCKCGCGQIAMDDHFMSMLVSLRKTSGMGLVINSGYRCVQYDQQIRGEGNHPTGKAADIQCADSATRFHLVYDVLCLGFKRIGIAKNFIHLDNILDSRPYPRFWLY